MSILGKVRDGFFKAINSKTADKAFNKFLDSAVFDLATGNNKGFVDKVNKKASGKCDKDK